MSSRVPRFDDFKPVSKTTSHIKQNNPPRNTSAELLLRRHLWKRGLRYQLHCKDLPGKPDVVFRCERVVVFCDGDFWHGRNWEERRAKLACGSNAAYWIPKIQANIDRDIAQAKALEDAEWFVVRFWETDIRKNPDAVAEMIHTIIIDARQR